ncbi:uncharacterized protein LOC116942470 [Petromyzon marinus]|uniref:uncharacterized protein LOC116942470 n=1 Tax=Petromyzon marinus TaxID=7757 RepID=UPI003F726C6D
MACAVAAPVPEPSGDFPAWLEAQGVNEEVARAMDSELGIRDYGVLRACVGDGLVRAELLAAARDRLPFGFYAVLRQVVKALRDAEPHDDDDAAAASSPCGDVTLAGLVDVLLALFSGLSRELLLSVRRLGVIDGQGIGDGGSSPLGAEIEHEDLIADQEKLATGDDRAVKCTDEYQNPDKEATLDSREPRDEGGDDSHGQPNLGAIHTWHGVKMEICDVAEIPWTAPGDNNLSNHGAAWEEIIVGEAAPVNPAERAGSCVGKGHSEFIIQDVTSLLATGKARPRAKRRDGDDEGTEENVDGHQPPWQRQRQQQQKKRTTEGMPDENTISEYATQPLAESQYKQGPPAATASGLHLGLLQRGGCFGLPVDRGTDQELVLAQQLQQAGGGKSGVAALSCDICGQAFAQRRILDVHRLTHTGEKPHRCAVCGRAFSQNCSLKRHQRTHTGERPHRCALCGRAFALPGDLKNHQRIHTGEKPYRCAVCDRSFSWYSSLKIHQNTHTRDRPSCCKVCGLVFEEHADFRHHQQAHARKAAEATEAAEAAAATLL